MSYFKKLNTRIDILALLLAIETCAWKIGEGSRLRKDELIFTITPCGVVLPPGPVPPDFYPDEH